MSVAQDDDCEASSLTHSVKVRLQELLQRDRELCEIDPTDVNPFQARSIEAALAVVGNPVRPFTFFRFRLLFSPVFSTTTTAGSLLSTDLHADGASGAGHPRQARRSADQKRVRSSSIFDGFDVVLAPP